MWNSKSIRRFAFVFALWAVTSLSCGVAAAQTLQNLQPKVSPSVLYLPNSSGILEVLFTGGRTFDLTNPFFQSLGTNGRTCFSCHKPDQGWVITPPRHPGHIQCYPGSRSAIQPR